MHHHAQPELFRASRNLLRGFLTISIIQCEMPCASSAQQSLKDSISRPSISSIFWALLFRNCPDFGHLLANFENICALKNIFRQFPTMHLQNPCNFYKVIFFYLKMAIFSPKHKNPDFSEGHFLRIFLNLILNPSWVRYPCQEIPFMYQYQFTGVGPFSAKPCTYSVPMFTRFR